MYGSESRRRPILCRWARPHTCLWCVCTGHRGNRSPSRPRRYHRPVRRGLNRCTCSALSWSSGKNASLRRRIFLSDQNQSRLCRRRSAVRSGNSWRSVQNRGILIRPGLLTDGSAGRLCTVRSHCWIVHGSLYLPAPGLCHPPRAHGRIRCAPAPPDAPGLPSCGTQPRWHRSLSSDFPGPLLRPGGIPAHLGFSQRLLHRLLLYKTWIFTPLFRIFSVFMDLIIYETSKKGKDLLSVLAVQQTSILEYYTANAWGYCAFCMILSLLF